ncbi:MAG: type II secretion system F family protein, partial [Candidatus Micrarchaeota archaeon]|nr:type II secretion system F family protein [Candidatus Micrarchaeota archaeon]
MKYSQSKYLQRLRQELKTYLYKADINISPGKYIKYSILGSIGVSLLLTFLISLLDPTFDIYFLSLIFLLLAIAAFLFFKRLPYLLAKARAADIESDLPIAIRSIGIQLNMKVPFEAALENIANSNYKCSIEFRKALNMIDGGASIPDALRQIAERVESRTVKKLMVQLIHVYLEGLDGTELKHSADELIDAQRFSFKEFSAKLSFLSLMFIAVSSIIPTMYLAYIVVSGTYLGTTTSPSDIWFTFLFVFPLINILLIVYIKYSTPPILSNISEKFLSKREEIMLDEILRNIHIKLKVKGLLLYSSLLAILLTISLYFVIGLFSLLFLLLPMVVYFILLWALERRANEIEQYLPDALLYAATLELGVPMEKIIENIGNAGYGALSDEFKKAERQINIGISINHALA